MNEPDPNLRNRPARRAFGLTVIAATLASGCWAAYAADPPSPTVNAPERIAAETVGVIGSGDRLALKLKGALTDRTLKLGEVYDGGWRLVGLTASKAVLAKDGATWEIGLNPTGALSSPKPTPPPSRVTLVGLPDEAMFQAYRDRFPDQARMIVEGATTHGLTEDEARRRFVYRAMGWDEFDRQEAAGARTILTPADQRALFGQTAYEDNLALALKENNAMVAEAMADLAARPVSGPTSYYVPADASAREVATAQGIDRRGDWTMSQRDAQGGYTMTLTAGTAEAYAAKYMLTSPTAMEGTVSR